MIIPKQPQSGFALLLTLVVISVVLAIGLSLLNITVKQFTLSATARDSELAFHAANTGIECALAAAESVDIFTGGAPAAIDFDCAGVNAAAVDDHDPDTNVYQYSASAGAYTGSGTGFTWSVGSPTGGTDEVCTEVDLFFLDSNAAGGSDVTYDFRAAGFGIDAPACENGNVCTYIFARGYNRPCDGLGGLRVVQREITLDF